MLKNIETKIPPTVLSTLNARKYLWGKNCDDWNLLDNESFGVKHERMGFGTEEAFTLSQAIAATFLYTQRQGRFESE